MSRRWISAQVAVLGLLISVSHSGSAAADGAYPIASYLSCGDRLDLCRPYCDNMAPPGFALGKCYDRCAIGAGICEASRIPGPRGDGRRRMIRR